MMIGGNWVTSAPFLVEPRVGADSPCFVIFIVVVEKWIPIYTWQIRTIFRLYRKVCSACSGIPNSVSALKLSMDKKLARENTVEELDNLRSQGYHLQLQSDVLIEQMLAMKAAN